MPSQPFSAAGQACFVRSEGRFTLDVYSLALTGAMNATQQCGIAAHFLSTTSSVGQGTVIQHFVQYTYKTGPGYVLNMAISLKNMWA